MVCRCAAPSFFTNGPASSDDQTDHDGVSTARMLLLSLDGAATGPMTSSVLAPSVASVASAGSSPRKSYYVPVFTPEDKVGGDECKHDSSRFFFFIFHEVAGVALCLGRVLAPVR